MPELCKNVGDIVYPGGLFVRVLSAIICVDGRIIIKWFIQKETGMLWT